MNLIVAVDKNWGIGFKNGLLARIPEDMEFFHSMTTGKVVVMGRKTLETLPGGLPLKNRVNIILTRNPDYHVEGAIVCHSMENAIKMLEKYRPEDVYVIGGENIYRQFLNLCDTAYVTRIEHEYEADAWFPVLDEYTKWKLVERSETKVHDGLKFAFCKYERIFK